MDYSLLVGIHDVERAEQEEVESEDNEGEDDGESDGGVGTPPDSPSNTLDSNKPLSPGEFDPTIDVYAIKSNDGEPPLPSCIKRFMQSLGMMAVRSETVQSFTAQIPRSVFFKQYSLCGWLCKTRSRSVSGLFLHFCFGRYKIFKANAVHVVSLPL